MDPRRCHLLLLLTSLLLCWPAFAAADADAAREEELRRKAQEIERLQEELRRAQADLRKLEAENQRVRTGKTPAASAVPAPSLESGKPAPGPGSLLPLDFGQVVEVSELVDQFAAEPEAARARYVKKEIRVRGTVAGFEARLLTRAYEVRLDSPERRITVLCRFRLPDHFAAVYTKRGGQSLVARVGERTEVPLLEVGDTVTIEGACKGLKKGELSFSGCEVLR